MISYAEAMERIRQHTGVLASEHVPLVIAHGRVLSEHVHSRCPLPLYPTAAVDGYAMACGSETLPIGSELRLERAATGTLATPAARLIRAGSVLPAGMDSVLPLTQVARLPATAEGGPGLRLKTELQAGAYVYAVGSQSPVGARILERGRRLDGPDIMHAAAAGAERIQVTARPGIALFSHGQPAPADSEAFCPSALLQDANTTYLDMMARSLGADVRLSHSLGLCPDYLESMLQQARDMGVQMIVCVRGGHALRGDRFMAVLRQLGATILFHAVACSPGAVICARFANGSLFFGLPAAPAALAASFRFFVVPTLGLLQGQPVEQPVLARWVGSHRPRGKLPGFSRARLFQRADGSLAVELAAAEAPHAGHATCASNAWALLPGTAAGLGQEAWLPVYGTIPDMLQIGSDTSRKAAG